MSAWDISMFLWVAMAQMNDPQGFEPYDCGVCLEVIDAWYLVKSLFNEPSHRFPVALLVKFPGVCLFDLIPTMFAPASFGTSLHTPIISFSPPISFFIACPHISSSFITSVYVIGVSPSTYIPSLVLRDANTTRAYVALSLAQTSPHPPPIFLSLLSPQHPPGPSSS